MFKNIFRKRHDDTNAQSAESGRIVNTISVEIVNGTGLNFSAFEENGETLKVWLPESVDSMLDAIALANDSFQSEIVRSILFVHVYGLADFEAMRTQKKGWFTPPPRLSAAGQDVSIRFSRSPNPFPELGKNIVAMKLWLPRQLLKDVATLAAQGGQKTSPYVRQTLIRSLLGAAYALDKSERLATSEANDWEDEKE